MVGTSLGAKSAAPAGEPVPSTPAMASASTRMGLLQGETAGSAQTFLLAADLPAEGVPR